VILELDMGNTRIKWRLRSDSGKVARGNFLSSSPFSELTAALEVAGLHTDKEPLARALVASVLGDERNRELHTWCEKKFAVTAEFARSGVGAGEVRNGYKAPELLGVDRWLALLAGYALTRQACVIVDCGSALTVDLLNSCGEHLGGYIAPGLKLMRNALQSNTQKIQMADVPSDFSLVPGRDTEACVTAAQSAMVCGLVEQALRQLRSHPEEAPALILTGGDAQWLHSCFPAAQVQVDLVLDGLSLALR